MSSRTDFGSLSEPRRVRTYVVAGDATCFQITEVKARVEGRRSEHSQRRVALLQREKLLLTSTIAKARGKKLLLTSTIAKARDKELLLTSTIAKARDKELLLTSTIAKARGKELRLTSTFRLKLVLKSYIRTSLKIVKIVTLYCIHIV